MGSNPAWKGTIFRGGEGRPIVKYRDYHPSAVAMPPFVKLSVDIRFFSGTTGSLGLSWIIRLFLRLMLYVAIC